MAARMLHVRKGPGTGLLGAAASAGGSAARLVHNGAQARRNPAAGFDPTGRPLSRDAAAELVRGDARPPAAPARKLATMTVSPRRRTGRVRLPRDRWSGSVDR
jgi:hypothetical protein